MISLSRTRWNVVKHALLLGRIKGKIMRLFVALFLLILTGCASVNVVETPIIEEKIGQIPTIGVEATAPVGGVIYSQFKYWSKIGYRIRNGHSVGIGLGKVAVSDGDFVVKVNLKGETAYCTEKAAYIDPMVGPFSNACFIDANNDGKFEKVKVAPSVVWFEQNVIPPLSFEKSEIVVPRTNSFKYELLYQGVSNNSLRLSYREYINDFARPAFFQDVSYDFSTKPITITFRTVRIEVMKADNNQIVYRLLTGF